MALLLDGTTGCPVTTVTGTLPVANGGTGVTTSTGSGANVLGTSPSISGAVLSTMASSVLTSATAQNSTSGTSIDFTSIPSWVKRITVMFNGVSTSATSQVQLQIGSGSFTTSGYASFISSVDGSSTSIASITSGFGWRSAQAAASVTYGIATLCLISGNTWVISMSTAQTSGFGSFMTGGLALGGTLDRVRITTVNGTDTFDAGSINIIYE